MSRRRKETDGDVIDLAAEKLKRQAKADGVPDGDDDDSVFVFSDELEAEGRVTFSFGGGTWNMNFTDARGTGLDFLAAADNAESEFWKTYRCNVCGKDDFACVCGLLHMLLPDGFACGAEALCATKHPGFVTCPRCIAAMGKKP
jgi:hypothetical protein